MAFSLVLTAVQLVADVGLDLYLVPRHAALSDGGFRPRHAQRRRVGVAELRCVGDHHHAGHRTRLRPPCFVVRRHTHAVPVARRHVVNGPVSVYDVLGGCFPLQVRPPMLYTWPIAACGILAFILVISPNRRVFVFRLAERVDFLVGVYWVIERLRDLGWEPDKLDAVLGDGFTVVVTILPMDGDRQCRHMVELRLSWRTRRCRCGG